MESKPLNQSKKSIFKGYFITIFLSLLVIMLINKYLFFSLKVPSKSMYPTIKPGNMINALRIHDRDSLKRGDIVVFYNKELNDTLIKRLIGLPVEKVTASSDGSIYI